MPHVTFTANLQRHVDAPSLTVPAATVAQALNAVFQRHPALKGYVLDEHGALRKHMIVFIDGEQIVDREQLTDPVVDETQIYVMQALSGGAPP